MYTNPGWVGIPSCPKLPEQRYLRSLGRSWPFFRISQPYRQSFPQNSGKCRKFSFGTIIFKSKKLFVSNKIEFCYKFPEQRYLYSFDKFWALFRITQPKHRTWPQNSDKCRKLGFGTIILKPKTLFVSNKKEFCYKLPEQRYLCFSVRFWSLFRNRLGSCVVGLFARSLLENNRLDESLHWKPPLLGRSIEEWS